MAGGSSRFNEVIGAKQHQSKADLSPETGQTFVDHIFATEAGRTIIRSVEGKRARIRKKTRLPNGSTNNVSENASETKTEKFFGFGTPAFASPEQWNYPNQTDVQSDIYSLGCTLFYLLTGAPIVAGSSKEVMNRKMAGETMLPSELRDEVLPGLDRIVARMTAVTPEERYDSMASVKIALEQVSVQPRVFISYRREDSLDAKDRLYVAPARTIEKDSLFIDIDSIPSGVDFRNHTASAVAVCDVLLAVIGNHWLKSTTEGGNRRIDDPADFVRLEIQSALQQKIPVIPVLVGQAHMPAVRDLPGELEALAFTNAAEIRAGSGYDAAIERLVQEIISIWRLKTPQ